MDATVPVQFFVSLIRELLPEPHAGLLAGILFGTKEALSKDLTEALIQTGTLHIVALSGMNISLIVTIVDTSLLRIVSRRISSLLSILFIMGFVWLVGVSPSVVRASIMAVLSIVAIQIGKPRWALWSWFVTVVGIGLVIPSWLGELSFQLSALATLGMILFGKKNLQVGSQIQEKTHSRSLLYHVWDPISDALHLTLAAQVFTLPLIFITFHRVSLVSPITNMLVGFVIPPITILGYAMTLLGSIYLPFARVFSFVLWGLLDYMIHIILWTSSLPFASVGV